MTGAVVVLALGVLVVAVTLISNAQRRLDDASAREAVLLSENARLQRALGAAEQSLRTLSNDPRLDSGLAVQVDIALDDLRRTSGELGPG
jgi:cell division septation protein DedD